MEYTIKNQKLCVRISSTGGEFRSICDTAGKEYLWQGDPETWTDRGPNLFPYIGRMTDKMYTVQGKTYHMDIHGFLPYMEMKLLEHEKNRLVLGLESSEETRKQYPFEFSLEIQWELKERTLEITYCVKNRDKKTMYFGIGGHPGFQVPMEDGSCFEDYTLDFGENAELIQLILSEDCFVTDGEMPFELRDGRYLDLRHDLFDNDAIVLRNMPGQVILSGKNGHKAIQVNFPDMNYLGIWHWPKTEVPYVCIEPWSSLPSRKDRIEALETQENLISLEAGDSYENRWSISVVEAKE